MKWISVEDRLPDKSGFYLVATRFENYRVRFTNFMMGGVDYPWANFNHGDITHWMPLPDPPAEP